MMTTTPDDLRRWVAPFGWTLSHFVWQGAAVALVAWALMTLARAARVRYAIGCGAIVAMLALPIATLARIGPDARPVTIVDASPRVDREPARMFIDETPRAGSRAKPNPTLRERLDRAAPALVATWLVGVAMLATRHVVGLAQLARLRRRASRIVDAAWTERVGRLSARLRLRSRVALLLTDRLDCPAVIGLFRPAILWPAAALVGLTPTQVEALLAHELAHVRRHDYAANLLQTLAETLLFYHPAVWWLSRRVRQEREHCCDDLAARVVGDRATYAGALAAMEALRQSPRLALSARGGSLLTRVQRLLAPATPRRLSPVGVGLIATTLVLAGVFACRPREPVAAATAATAATQQSASSPASQPAAVAWPAQVEADVRASCARDPFARRLLDLRDDLAIQLVQAGQTRGANSPSVVSLRAQIESVDDRIGKIAAQLDDALGRATARQPVTDSIREGDLLRVTVLDLAGVGVQSVEWKRVERGGAISMPYIGRVGVGGRAPSEAEAVIARGYEGAHVLAQANVGVLVVQDASGRTLVPAELLATGGIVPKADGPPRPEAPMTPRVWSGATLQGFAAIDPTLRWLLDSKTAAEAEITRLRHSDGYASNVQFVERALADIDQKVAARAEAIANDGSPRSKLVRQQAQRQELVDALAAATKEHGETSNEALAARSMLAQLDQQFAPVGEYYVSGAVARPGVYSLTARKITLSQAVIAAGGSGADGDASHDFNIDVIRRDPVDGAERSTRFRWRDVAGGKSGKFYLLANDQVLVGGDATTAPATGPVSTLDGLRVDRIYDEIDR